MIRNNSPETFTKRKVNRRVKSEVPEFFINSNSQSVRKYEGKKTFLQVSYDISKFSNSHDSALSKHREIILDLLKQNKNLDDQIWEKLKEITQIPDLLTDVIYRKIRGDSKSSIPKNKYKEELDEYRKFASNLQTQLVKAKQSNDELSNMLLSVEVQQKLNVVFI